MSKRASVSGSKPRRSARLNNTGGVLERLEPRRRIAGSNSTKKRRSSCMVSDGRVLRVRNSAATPTLMVKSEVLTCEELSEREKALRNGERELRRRTLSLDEREADLEKTFEKREAEAILKHLEEYFTCSLCFEIIACPYMLSPAECGHSFCAICTIKWFFSRLHRGCGTWHESVACPLCRSLLIITPDVIPRPTITIPFAHNRLAEKTLKGMIERLAEICTGPKAKYKQNATSRAPCKAGEARVKIEEPASGKLGEVGIEAWGEGGALRQDWLDRERMGLLQMNGLITRWNILTGIEFVEIKDRLGL